MRMKFNAEGNDVTRAWLIIQTTHELKPLIHAAERVSE